MRKMVNKMKIGLFYYIVIIFFIDLVFKIGYSNRLSVLFAEQIFIITIIILMFYRTSESVPSYPL